MEELFSHLNSICPSIQFTIRKEQDGTLPFLDALSQWKEDGTLELNVYRKPTHTDRHLQFSSHHPGHVKRGLIG